MKRTGKTGNKETAEQLIREHFLKPFLHESAKTLGQEVGRLPTMIIKLKLVGVPIVKEILNFISGLKNWWT